MSYHFDERLHSECMYRLCFSIQQAPPGSSPLTEDEEKRIFDELQGLWEVILIDPRDDRSATTYSKVYVSGKRATFSGCSRVGGGPSTIELSLTKSPTGVLYLDRFCTVVTKYEPQNGKIELSDGIKGSLIQWSRAPQQMPITVITNQPNMQQYVSNQPQQFPAYHQPVYQPTNTQMVPIDPAYQNQMVLNQQNVDIEHNSNGMADATKNQPVMGGNNKVYPQSNVVNL